VLVSSHGYGAGWIWVQNLLAGAIGAMVFTIAMALTQTTTVRL